MARGPRAAVLIPKAAAQKDVAVDATSQRCWRLLQTLPLEESIVDYLTSMIGAAPDEETLETVKEILEGYEVPTDVIDEIRTLSKTRRILDDFFKNVRFSPY